MADPCDKLLYLTVPKRLDGEFQALVKSGSRPILARWIHDNLGPNALHVLPQPADDLTTLYAVILPADALPMKHYSGKAKSILNMLGMGVEEGAKKGEYVLRVPETLPTGEKVLKVVYRHPVTTTREEALEEITKAQFELIGKGTLPSGARIDYIPGRRVREPVAVADDFYVTPVQFPEEAIKAVKKFLPVGDEQRRLSVAPPHILRYIKKLEDLLDYLRAALILDSEVSGKLAAAARAKREALEEAAAGAYDNALQKYTEAQGHIFWSAMEQVQEIEKKMTGVVPDEVQKAIDLYRTYMGNPETMRVAQKTLFENLTPTEEGALPIEEFVFRHPDGDQQIRVTKRTGTRPEFRLEKEEPVPTGGVRRVEFYEVRVIGPSKKRDMIFRSLSSEEVADLVVNDPGYSKVIPRRVLGYPYLHRENANLGASIATVGDKTVVKIYNLADELDGTTTAPLADIETVEVPNVSAAEALLEERGFYDRLRWAFTPGTLDLQRGMEIGERYTTLDRFVKQVPDPASHSKDVLQAFDRSLREALIVTTQTLGRAPDEFFDWLVRWEEAWWKHVGTPPFANYPAFVRDALGIATPGDLLSPRWRTPFRSYLPRRTYTYYRDKPHTPEYYQHLKDIKRLQDNLEKFGSEITPVERSPVAATELSATSVEYMRLAELTDGRRVRIVDLALDDPDSMLVEDVTGKQFHVAKSEVQRVLKPSSRFDLWWETAMKIREGEMPVFHDVPPIGLGVVEKELGFFGVTDRIVVEDGLVAELLSILRGGQPAEGVIPAATLNKITQAAAKAAKRAGLTGKEAEEAVQEAIKRIARGMGFKRTLTDEEAERAVSIFRRLSQLGMAKDLLREERVGPRLSRWEFEALRYAVYNRVYNEFGGHPVADIVARTELRLLTNKEEDALTKIVHKFYGKDARNLSDVEKARWYAEATKSMPEVAEAYLTLKNTLGFVRFLMKAGPAAPPGGVTIRNVDVATKDLFHAGVFSPFVIPRVLFQHHPTARVLRKSFNRVESEERAYIRNHAHLMGDLQLRYSKKELAEIMNLLDKHATWAEAKAAGAPSKYLYGFEQWDKARNEARYDLIWTMLRLGNQSRPLRYLADGSIDPRDVALLVERGFEPTKVPKDFLIMDRLRSRQGAWSDTEIETFVHYLRLFKDADELKASIPNVPEKFVEVFNFWREFGIKSFFPYVHEGTIPIYKRVLDPATNKVVRGDVVGFADYPYRAYQMARQAVREGKLQPGMWEIGEEIQPVLDNFTLTMVGDRFWRLRSMMARSAGLSDEEANYLLLQAGIAPGSRSAFLAHAQTREANLKPLLDDPVRHWMIYISRLSSARRRFKMSRIVESLNQVDESLSRSYGVEPLRLGDVLMMDTWGGRAGSRKMDSLRRHVKDYIKAALGEYGTQDSILDSAVGVLSYVYNTPKEKMLALLGKDGGVPLSTILQHGKAYAFTPRGTGRRLSQDALALQSVIRLANFASPLINLTQTAINTAPFLGTKYTVWGMRDAVQYLMHQWKPGTGPSPALPDLDIPVQAWIEQLGIGLDVVPDPATSMTQLYSGPMKFIPPRGAAGRVFRNVEHYAMWGFQKAETTNRLTALFGGYRYARDKLKLSPSAARQWAEELVERTQFLYSNAELPIFLRGPIMRTIFMFRPFLVQQLGLQKDLLLTALGRQRIPGMTPLQAQKVLLKHMLALYLIGGVGGVTQQPLFWGPNWAVKWLTGRGVDERLQMEILAEREEDVGDNDMWFSAWDIIENGIPGVMGMALGPRVAIAGTDLTPYRPGPLVQTYIGLWEVVKSYMQTQRGKALPTLGGAAAGVLGPRLVRVPGLTRLLQGVLGGMAGSTITNAPLHHYLQTTDEGRAFLKQLVGTMARNVLDFIELYTLGGDAAVPKDYKLRPMWSPYLYDPMLGPKIALLYEFTGMPSADQARAHLLVDLLLRQQKDARDRRDYYHGAIAQAIVKNDDKAFWDALWRAHEEGIYTDMGAVQERIEKMLQPATVTIQRGIPIGERGIE